MRVHSVAPGSPAERAALLPADILVRVDDDVIENQTSLAVVMAKHRPGDRVLLTFVRGGVEHAVRLSLAASTPTGDPPPEPSRRERRRTQRNESLGRLDSLRKPIGRQVR